MSLASTNDSSTRSTSNDCNVSSTGGAHRPQRAGGADPAVALAGAPVVVRVVRSGFVESVHHAIVAVTQTSSATETNNATETSSRELLSRGDVTAPILPRSANKPAQAVGMLRAGLDLTGRHLALACASHSGEDFHLQAVAEILADHGLSEADLRNTPDLPYEEHERARWLAAGRAPTSLAQNCSGKHAAMLVTCRINGWDLEGYLDPAHPLQVHLAETAADLAGEPVAATTVDGCGAPALGISTAGLARTFGRLAAAAEGTPERRVADAMRAHPEYVAGSTRDVTAVMRGLPGAVAKDGAEAVYAVGLADGRGVAVKIADGSQRVRPVVLAATLLHLGVDAPVLRDLARLPVLGHGQPVGAFEVDLDAHLADPAQRSTGSRA
ncbi:asparaginase [Arsenicicoccus piscis]|uniref:Asparaginase n=1 Tax=Arsenicicoccus piscis TaxID=673954 RepID=A0ABQ6HQZ8_9MICO|nr:asparaginase [Arsenicicoccus piscis]MCH8627893.1 asparaginase [Arsenicicoccus piscis]GMA20787.1 asparaginase [Arsenicicoccus piscis]